MIIYSGLDISTNEFKSLADHFVLKGVASANEAIATNLLQEANVFLLGTGIVNPVNEIQKIYDADKQLAVILLALPIHFKQIKQSVQFAPFVGKNSLVVALSPELDLRYVCKSAASRTVQRRSFYKINLNPKSAAAPEQKIKLAHMGAFLEYAPISTILLTDTDRIINYNQQAKKLFPTLEFIDIELGHLFSKKESDVIRSFIHDGHNPEARKEIEFQQKILELTSTIVYNEEGQRHFLLLFNNITNERLEAKRIQSVLEALPQMAWTTNADGMVTYLTKGWYFYTGQTREEALGEGWASVVYTEDRERLSNLWQSCIKSGTSFQHAARYKKANGEYRWHLARATAIRDAGNHISMWVGTCTDIHDQILLTEELERKVKERTRSLELSNSELEQFAHISSHDLQEPLRKIRTFADLLKVHSNDKLDDTSKRYLEKIAATAERMSNSLKALLDFTQLQGDEKFVPVNLNEIVDHILVDLELMISQKGAVVEVGTLPVVKGVPVQMQQLFYNLINNALKFSRKDVAPEIEITCRRLGQEELFQFTQLAPFKNYDEIVVKDNGVGFDQKNAEKIFTIFQRLHARTEFEGTGIGLSLVKKVARNHGGEVYAVSEIGHGTSFHIILPVG